MPPGTAISHRTWYTLGHLQIQEQSPEVIKRSGDFFRLERSKRVQNLEIQKKMHKEFLLEQIGLDQAENDPSEVSSKLTNAGGSK